MSVVTVRLQLPVNFECSGTVNSTGTELAQSQASSVPGIAILSLHKLDYFNGS